MTNSTTYYLFEITDVGKEGYLTGVRIVPIGNGNNYTKKECKISNLRRIMLPYLPSPIIDKYLVIKNSADICCFCMCDSEPNKFFKLAGLIFYLSENEEFDIDSTPTISRRIQRMTLHEALSTLITESSSGTMRYGVDAFWTKRELSEKEAMMLII